MELQGAMKKERKKIENMENNNNLFRGGVEQIAAPVIRMEAIEDNENQIELASSFHFKLYVQGQPDERRYWEDEAGEEGMRYDQEQQDRRDELEAENQRQARQYTDDYIME